MQYHDPHVPSEAELKKEESGVHSENTVEEYQQRSVQEAQSWVRRVLAWMSDFLRGLHLTPAKLALGLGVLGIIISAGKNKRLVRWAVLSIISLLLTIVGICAMIFDWPYMT